MVTLGYVLSHEQFPVPSLIECAVAAERAGFDAVWTSDHFHPWQDNEGHAGYAWVTLAALGQRTSRLLYGTAVTCPTYRYRPAEVAEAFASLSLLNPGRVFLGVGTGEALNELPAGGGWGDYQERADRLAEAVEIIRKLWTGEWVAHRGRYYTVENARLYDTPAQPIP
ncbi:MAG TPA: TIGR03557 family F420-dependent LLM class oxidoreductase, partial [Dehalococcoidia bacterium]